MYNLKFKQIVCIHVIVRLLYVYYIYICFRIIGGPGEFKTNSWLEKIVVVGLDKAPKSLKLSNKSKYFIFLLCSYNKT